MATIHREVTSRVGSEHLPPLAVTVRQACELSGYGPTTIWGLLKSGRLKAVRVAGIRRTTIDYQSLKNLLAPSAAEPQPKPRRRGRPRKHTDGRVTS